VRSPIDSARRLRRDKAAVPGGCTRTILERCTSRILLKGSGEGLERLLLESVGLVDPGIARGTRFRGMESRRRRRNDIGPGRGPGRGWMGQEKLH